MMMENGLFLGCVVVGTNDTPPSGASLIAVLLGINPFSFNLHFVPQFEAINSSDVLRVIA